MTKTASKKAESNKTANNAFNKYFDGVAEVNTNFVEGLAKVRESNTRIIDKLLETVEKGQKDLLELNRAITSAPTEYKTNLKLAMDTMTKRQACAIELGKTMYQEQSALNAAYSEKAEELFAPLKNAEVDWMAPYKKINEFWTAGTK